MLTIRYRKHFLTGLLAGLEVSQSFQTSLDVAGLYTTTLKSFTRQRPGSDYGTRDKFFVTNVEVE